MLLKVQITNHPNQEAQAIDSIKINETPTTSPPLIATHIFRSCERFTELVSRFFFQGDVSRQRNFHVSSFKSFIV
ncbi:hypothetical protein AWH61_09705 [Alteromonas sp. W12]|nr:hypothetical protein AWH61_09705 [Alteromonas sp. W12]